MRRTVWLGGVLSNIHLQFEMSTRHPNAEVIRVIVYRHLEFRGEISDGETLGLSEYS